MIEFNSIIGRLVEYAEKNKAESFFTEKEAVNNSLYNVNEKNIDNRLDAIEISSPEYSKTTNPFQSAIERKAVKEQDLNQLTQLSSISNELKPSKFGCDIVKRLLERKDEFSPEKYASMNKNEKLKLLNDEYNIFQDELCIPQKDRIPITVTTLSDGTLGEYDYSAIKSPFGGIRLINESLNIDSAFLEKADYWQATNTLLHETMHKFQSYITFTDQKLFPYQQLKDDISASLFTQPLNLWEYYFSPCEMQAYQTADYITKVYKELYQAA